MLPFFSNFGKNILKVFSVSNLLFQLLAIALTGIIVATDFDWKYYQATRGIPTVFIWPAVIGGMVLPIILPFILLAIGKLLKSAKTLAAAYTLGQAALLSYLISIFFKAFTGRVPPEFGRPMMIDISQQFRFGLLRGGVFWGWPSSHTTVAFAMALSLISLFPKSVPTKILALFYALYIGLAVSTSIHWFSEFVAGAIIGSAIGITVGQSFYQKLTNG